MASNNYAEVITDLTEARRIMAEFEDMAARGCSFKVLQFNPAVDRYEISCWRESNFPTLPDVEEGGTTLEGAAIAALWNSNPDTVGAVNFGNGYFGLFFESEGQRHIAIPEQLAALIKRKRMHEDSTGLEKDREQLMTKQEIEALGQAMLKDHGISDWSVRAVCERDDMGDEDDIAGRYGRAFHQERLIWVNMRYAGDRTLVREILLHEVAHALLGAREGDQHGDEFQVKLREIGGGLVEAPRK